MEGASTFLHRDVARIKDDMRLTAERMWGMDPATFEGIDPMVDLLLSAFAQEVFNVQQEVNRHKLRMVEMAAQSLLPTELSGPRPSHLLMHGRPLDQGTFTHRIKTVLSASQSMDVHDRVGRTFTFTPADEFRLHNGAVKYLVHGNKLHVIDGRNGSKRVLMTGDGRPLNSRELWIGIEMKEAVDPSSGLALLFTLATNDADEWQLRLRLPEFSLEANGIPCRIEPGIRPRFDKPPAFNQVRDPVRTMEHEAISYYQERFITLHAPAEAPKCLSQSGPPPPIFTEVFGSDLVAELGREVTWMRVRLPSSLDPAIIHRLNCSINCFPAINRKWHECTASGTSLIPLEHDSRQQFWAVESVITSDRVTVTRASTPGHTVGKDLFYSLRRGGIERLDDREAFERLTDLLQTVRNDYAAFAALDENDLAEGLTHVKAWLHEYRTRHKAPPFPPVYLMLSNTPEGNVHVDYWSTNGAAADRIPALKPFRLESGSFLNDVRSMSVPVGGEDTPQSESITERMRSALANSGQAIPSMFAVRALCMDSIPVQLRPQVKLDVKRDVMLGDSPKAGLQRVLKITLRVSEPSSNDHDPWTGVCAHVRNVLDRQLQGLIPVSVEHAYAP